MYAKLHMYQWYHVVQIIFCCMSVIPPYSWCICSHGALLFDQKAPVIDPALRKTSGSSSDVSESWSVVSPSDFDDVAPKNQGKVDSVVDGASSTKVRVQIYGVPTGCGISVA